MATSWGATPAGKLESSLNVDGSRNLIWRPTLSTRISPFVPVALFGSDPAARAPPDSARPRTMPAMTIRCVVDMRRIIGPRPRKSKLTSCSGGSPENWCAGPDTLLCDGRAESVSRAAPRTGRCGACGGGAVRRRDHRGGAGVRGARAAELSPRVARGSGSPGRHRPLFRCGLRAGGGQHGGARAGGARR